jgi:hypothetical protein
MRTCCLGHLACGVLLSQPKLTKTKTILFQGNDLELLGEVRRLVTNLHQQVNSSTSHLGRPKFLSQQNSAKELIYDSKSKHSILSASDRSAQYEAHSPLTLSQLIDGYRHSLDLDFFFFPVVLE